MPARLSRRKVTEYIADQLIAGTRHDDVIRQLAAYLIDTRRTNELELIVRDIEYALSERGVVLAHVTSAFDLTETTKAAVRDMIANHTNAETIYQKQLVDPDVIGGIRIDIPSRSFDSTIAHRLNTLMNYKK